MELAIKELSSDLAEAVSVLDVEYEEVGNEAEVRD